MTKDKSFKRRVRERMTKTGEAYTAARKSLLSKPKVEEYPSIAGMSDAAVQKATGYVWKEWVKELDAAGAKTMPHKEIARYVQASYDVNGWWSQAVTVAYERIRGLRATGQRRGGTYDANKSKTIPVPLSKLYGAFSTKRIRTRWLPDVDMTIRTSTKDKSMRITWPDGTDVHVHFTAKDQAKSVVAIQHGKLASEKSRQAQKAFWGERLEALKALLVDGS